MVDHVGWPSVWAHFHDINSKCIKYRKWTVVLCSQSAAIEPGATSSETEADQQRSATRPASSDLSITDRPLYAAIVHPQSTGLQPEVHRGFPDAVEAEDPQYSNVISTKRRAANDDIHLKVAPSLSSTCSSKYVVVNVPPAAAAASAGPTKSRPEPPGTVRNRPDAVRSRADAVWVSREWNQCKTSTKLAMRCYVLQFIVV